MNTAKNKLYLIVFIACLFGIIWLLYNLLHVNNQTEGLTVCYMKNITTLPCPSCGTTRSVLAILKGNFYNSIMINPLGWVIFIFIITIPFWISYDVLRSKSSFYVAYKNTEKWLKRPYIYLPLISLIVANWVWNIYKEL